MYPEAGKTPTSNQAPVDSLPLGSNPPISSKVLSPACLLLSWSSLFYINGWPLHVGILSYEINVLVKCIYERWSLWSGLWTPTEPVSAVHLSLGCLFFPAPPQWPVKFCFQPAWAFLAPSNKFPYCSHKTVSQAQEPCSQMCHISNLLGPGGLWYSLGLKGFVVVDFLFGKPI